jgi:hypothetical protein
MFVHRHGNWKHGEYAKSSIAASRELRRVIRIVRNRKLWDVSIPDLRPRPQSWSALRAASDTRGMSEEAVAASLGGLQP